LLICGKLIATIDDAGDALRNLDELSCMALKIDARNCHDGHGYRSQIGAISLKNAVEFMKPLLGFISPQRFRRKPLTSEIELSEFLSTRSAYIAQTSLFGYLKTRMGTQFRSYFEDDAFSKVIHNSSMLLYVSCLSDLTVFSVGLLAERNDHSVAELHAIASRLFAGALEQGVTEGDRNLLPTNAVTEFEERLKSVVWTAAAKGENAFAGSVNDLLRYAPIVDEFKELDREIVRNSIRFRWRDVRAQLRRRLRPEAFNA
jgi:hypothetical protein